MIRDEFPTFYQMSRTDCSVDTPKHKANSVIDFFEFMKERGWVFTERLYTDFELSTTYSIHNSIHYGYGHKEWDKDFYEYQKMNLPSLILERYEEKGLVHKDLKALPLCDYCDYSKECYSGNESRKPNLVNSEWSLIELPWIGQHYSKKKIAFLGINPNEDGGLNQLEVLVNAAKAELEAGKTKVNFGYTYPDGKKYSGTFLWHRIAAYSKIIQGAMEIAKDDIFKEIEFFRDENFAPEKVACEFDNISFLNHIKCSPLGNRSKPTNKMWENCGKSILLDELKILRPEWLIVLGDGDNAWAFEKNVLESNVHVKEGMFEGSYRCFTTTEFGLLTKVIVVPHPAAPGGADKDHYLSLYGAVQRLIGVGH